MGTQAKKTQESWSLDHSVESKPEHIKGRSRRGDALCGGGAGRGWERDAETKSGRLPGDESGGTPGHCGFCSSIGLHRISLGRAFKKTSRMFVLVSRTEVASYSRRVYPNRFCVVVYFEMQPLANNKVCCVFLCSLIRNCSSWTCPAWKEFTEMNRRRYTRQQPGTKSGRRPGDKPRINRGSTARCCFLHRFT